VAEATPSSEEAQRCLGFFINSLGHPHLDRPTSLDKMWSWSILTPLYEEDVMYALEGNRLAKEVSTRGSRGGQQTAEASVDYTCKAAQGILKTDISTMRVSRVPGATDPLMLQMRVSSVPGIDSLLAETLSMCLHVDLCSWV
jgi:hypothetical protein